MTAKEWRDKNPNINGNLRDYATMNELICLANFKWYRYKIFKIKSKSKIKLLKKFPMSIIFENVLKNFIY